MFSGQSGGQFGLEQTECFTLVEDVLQMSINNDELRNLRAVGDVKTFIDCKIRGLPKNIARL